eukprot:248826_1
MAARDEFDINAPLRSAARHGCTMPLVFAAVDMDRPHRKTLLKLEKLGADLAAIHDENTILIWASMHCLPGQIWNMLLSKVPSYYANRSNRYGCTAGHYALRAWYLSDAMVLDNRKDTDSEQSDYGEGPEQSDSSSSVLVQTRDHQGNQTFVDRTEHNRGWSNWRKRCHSSAKCALDSLMKMGFDPNRPCNTGASVRELCRGTRTLLKIITNRLPILTTLPPGWNESDHIYRERSGEETSVSKLKPSSCSELAGLSSKPANVSDCSKPAGLSTCSKPANASGYSKPSSLFNYVCKPISSSGSRYPSESSSSSRSDV